MTREEIFHKLDEVFQDVFDDDEISVNEETTANDIEDWDSLEHINLVVAVEMIIPGLRPTLVTVQRSPTALQRI